MSIYVEDEEDYIPIVVNARRNHGGNRIYLNPFVAGSRPKAASQGGIAQPINLTVKAPLERSHSRSYSRHSRWHSDEYYSSDDSRHTRRSKERRRSRRYEPHIRKQLLEAIDRDCLRTLRCPDVLAVKDRLLMNKDNLLLKSFEWILQVPQYNSWKNSNDTFLLWINGGAGKGKTMLSIGLIEQLADDSTVVTYFFCQKADSELNTIEAITKGLILCLVNQQGELKEFLRSRWDSENKRFDQDITWHWLWDVFLEMLKHCKCRRVYVVVDALDECQDLDVADLLKRIVQNGLSQASKIKWLLTCRPLDNSGQELLAGSDQLRITLELNSKHVAEAVKTYIADKVAELDHRYCYGQTLRQELETELIEKAEDIFLWASLVCKRLESMHQDEVLTTIQEIPPGLHPLYNQMLNQLIKSETSVLERCIRLLKVMMMAYRPLNMAEVSIVTGQFDEEVAIQTIVDLCASFVNNLGTDIELVHQSARDYLAGMNGQFILNSYNNYGHYEIALSCLSYLSEQLKINLVNLPRPDSTRDDKRDTMVASMDYPATFWVQHLHSEKRTALLQNTFAEQGEVTIFLRSKLLEWLECLSLLDKLPFAIDALKELIYMADSTKSSSLSKFLQDATCFLLQHRQTLATWPLQIYSSAIVFSPQTSIVRQDNLHKVPRWLRTIPQVDETWALLSQTLTGHTNSVCTVTFSPDSECIASTSNADRRAIILRDTATGELTRTLVGHSDWVRAVTFSPDSKQVASASNDETIKLWDAMTGELQTTLIGHSDWVHAVAFSPDNKQVVSGSSDKTIKLWDTSTGELWATLTGCSDWIRRAPRWLRKIPRVEDTWVSLTQTLIAHSDWVRAVVFSPDSKQIASGSDDKTIKLWDAMTRKLQLTLVGHSDWVRAVAFSPNSKQVASASDDQTIKLWDAMTGQLQVTLVSYSDQVCSMAFSPDSKWVASVFRDKTIKLWDRATRELQVTLSSHSDLVHAVALSPDSKWVASTSGDKTIKLWDARTGKQRKTLVGNSDWVRKVPGWLRNIPRVEDTWVSLTQTGELRTTPANQPDQVCAVMFSPDSNQVASASGDETIKMWDVTKYLKYSRWLGGTLDSRHKFRKHEQMETSESVDVLKFSADGRYLITNLGSIKAFQSIDLDALDELYVKGQWIYYGAAPVFYLQPDFQPQCFDVRGDQVTIGFQNGRVLSFDIDRRSLHSVLG